MIEIIFHGRGGQGAVKSAQILALAASIEGKYAQAFPNFGIERSGAPVEAYCRISDEPILLRSQIYEADYAVVLDSSLLKIKDIKAKKKIIVNSSVGKCDLKETCAFDATTLALQVFGKPIVSTAILAIFSGFTNVVKKESLVKACGDFFSGDVLRKNVVIINEVYKKIGNKT
ncbi:MAG: 2-oxoacid:acceptor oxidoreductase family protein [Candidatus Pacearchaeota archaeon]|nr:2-oxoacid:acceptor oxidoreductase family protein [Candidatus Pacearchaeota archaeon]